MIDQKRLLAPEPRVPAAASSRVLPPPDVFGDGPGSVELARLHKLLADTLATVGAVDAGRPGGRDWDAAETLMLASGDVDGFAAFVAGDSQRVAAAIHAARTAVARLDGLRAELDWAPAVEATAAGLLRACVEAHEQVTRAWAAAQHDMPDADSLLAAAAERREEAQRLQALLSWLTGRDREFVHAGRWPEHPSSRAVRDLLWVCTQAQQVRRGRQARMSTQPDGFVPPVGWYAWLRDLGEAQLHPLHGAGAVG